MRLTVYSRAWCHLCDDLCAALAPLAERYGVPVDVIDVDSDPSLDERYGERVPVVLAGETELCHYWLDTARVVEAFEAAGITPDSTGERRPTEPGAAMEVLSNVPQGAEPVEPADNGVRPADFS